MLNIIQARADNLQAGQQIDLDVEGFIIEEVDDDNNSERDSGNLRDLEGFIELEG